jgi:hypothetical protein
MKIGGKLLNRARIVIFLLVLNIFTAHAFGASSAPPLTPAELKKCSLPMSTLSKRFLREIKKMRRVRYEKELPKEEVQALIKDAEDSVQQTSRQVRRELELNKDTQVGILVIGAGPSAAAMAARLAQKTLGNPKMNVLFVSANGIAPEFREKDFILNSPYMMTGGYKGDYGKPEMHVEGHDTNPIGESPLDVFELSSGIIRDQDGFTQKPANYNGFVTKPTTFMDYWASANMNNPQLFFPASRRIYEASVLSFQSSGFPILTDGVVKSIEMGKDPVVELEGGIRLHPQVLVLATGAGPEKIPFESQKGKEIFKEFRIAPDEFSPKTFTYDDFFNQATSRDFFNTFAGEETLVIGEGDSGNTVIEKLFGIDPRGWAYEKQASPLQRNLFKVTWSGQKARTKEEFLQNQNLGRSSTSRGIFRAERYAKIGDLFKYKGSLKPTPLKVKDLDLDLDKDGLFLVTFSDGSTRTFARIISTTGHDNTMLNSLGPQNFVTVPSRDFGIVGLKAQTAPIYVSGVAASTQFTDHFSKIGSYIPSIKDYLEIKNPTALINNSHRAETLADTIFQTWLDDTEEPLSFE